MMEHSKSTKRLPSLVLGYKKGEQLMAKTTKPAQTEQKEGDTLEVEYGQERCPVIKGHHWCVLPEGHGTPHISGLNNLEFSETN